MDKSSKTKQGLTNNKNDLWYYTLGLVGLILILVAGVFLFPPNEKENNDEPDDFVNGPAVKIIGISDNKIIEEEGVKINLTNDWIVSTKYLDSEVDNFTCEAIDPCIVYEIYNQSTETKYYISTKSFVKFESGFVQEVIEKELNQFKLHFDKLKTLKDSANGTASTAGDTIYSQIYGCTEKNICISSAVLDLDFEKNKSQVLDFEKFVSEITFSETAI